MTAPVLVGDPGDPRLAMFRGNERSRANRPQRRDDAGAGTFLAEGDLVVERTFNAGYTAVAALVDQQRIPAVVARLPSVVPVYAATTEVRAALTGLSVPSPIVAIFQRRARPSVAALAERAARLVIVEAVDNPVNVGGIVRNAAGLGWDGLVLDQTSADPLSRRALRVSMGHGASLPHARTTDLAAAVADLVGAGFATVALTPHEPSVALDRVVHDERLALIIGSERAGLSPALLAAATVRARIPMHAGVDSLNAAAASAIACYALGPRT